MSNHLEAFLAGCNIVAIHKNNYSYGMCCAWAQMVDWDRVTVLLGAQSSTAKNITKGDVVGVSALAKGQNHIALQLGEGHSDEVNKFKDITTEIHGNAILIPGAKVMMICEVMDRLVLETSPDDYFLVLKVQSFRMDDKKEFLSAHEVLHP
ncbi:MAG: flavin reductase [Bacilli bacterium]|jgi:flavin reductase (DIM6/NTAB) family NADH-FMN oxidoreductase RutF|nr:flavin reductase [Bacilli bacterium]